MFDARWGHDPRDRDDTSRDLSRGSRGASDPRDRERVDPRDVFMEHVNLPRGLEREHVHYHGHDYTLRGSETRTLTTVGAVRAVPASDLRDSFDQPLDPRHGELWHLRDSGLVQTVRLDRDHTVVTLTKEGRDLLESRRFDDDARDRQSFYPRAATTSTNDSTRPARRSLPLGSRRCIARGNRTASPFSAVPVPARSALPSTWVRGASRPSN